MKILTYILLSLAFVLLAYNATQLDFSNLLGKENKIALICIAASVCAILLLAILLQSKKVARKIKEAEKAV